MKNLPENFYIDMNAEVPGTGTGMGDEVFRPALYVWETRTVIQQPSFFGIRVPIVRTQWWLVAQDRDVKFLIKTAQMMAKEKKS